MHLSDDNLILSAKNEVKLGEWQWGEDGRSLGESVEIGRFRRPLLRPATSNLSSHSHTPGIGLMD